MCEVWLELMAHCPEGIFFKVHIVLIYVLPLDGGRIPTPKIYFQCRRLYT